MIVDKRSALQSHTSVTVICDRCAQTEALIDFDDELREALVDDGYLRDFRRELALLDRAQRLFAKFPRSRHPIKVAKEHGTFSGESTAPDPEFEQALQQDSKLYDFLVKTSFLLPARLHFVREQVGTLGIQPAHRRLCCAVCRTGRLHLEPAFFDSLA